MRSVCWPIRRHLVLAAALAAMAVVLPASGRSEAQAAFACRDVFVTGARGSGQSVGDANEEILQFFSELKGRIDTTVISYDERELGSSAYDGFQYPAVGLDFINLLDAEFGLGPIGDYRESVEEGIAEAAAYLNDRAAACPDEVWVLSGYSQGAQVMGGALSELTDAALQKIAFVALFGDPKLDNGRRGFFIGPDIPTRCIGNELEWIRGTIFCFEPGGVLEARRPYLPDPIDVRTGSWCDRRDFICNGNLLYKINDTHGEYDSAWVPLAAVEAAERLQVSRDQLPWQDGFDIDRLLLGSGFGFDGRDWVFVIDTTGSMGPSINDVKAEAVDIARFMLEDDPFGLEPRRVALVEFRDHGDPFVSRVVVPLTEDLQTFVDGVNGLVASGGGDFPEAVYSGLFTAFNELDWRLNASKVAILIGDAPAKDPEPITGYTLQQMEARALEVDPVNVYPIAIGSGPLASYQAIADATSGVLLQSTASNLGETIIEAINVRATTPQATLRPDYYIAEPGTPITFSAADSFDPDAGLVAYRWDFEADGVVDVETTEPTVVHTYTTPYEGLMAVTVVSEDGGTGNAVATVFVSDDPMAQLAPAPAASVTAAPGAEAGRIEVAWTPSPDEIGSYRLYLPDGTFLTAVAGDRTSVSVIGLIPGDELVVQVVAVGRFGPSQPAASNSVVVPGGGVLTAGVDILPGSDTNPIRLRRKGVLPVALLGSASFDVAGVDVGTLTFGPGLAVPAHDLSKGGHIEDVDGDGHLDLMLHFNVSSIGLQSGDTEICLSGALAGGAVFQGCDSITILD